MKQRSVMQHQFSQVPTAEIPRSSFDRSHGYKTTFNAGSLIPFLVDEALPGDTFNLRTSGFARLATPIFPIMDNMHMETFYFAVPIRLVWENFQKMMGEQDSPDDSTDFLVPQVVQDSEDGYPTSSLADYLGIPVGVPVQHSALFWRAYALIWDEWFRDQNLQNGANVPKDDGPDNPNNVVFVLPRGKRHDYFTSCLPWPQKGPAVELPLGSTAPVNPESNTLAFTMRYADEPNSEPAFEIGTSAGDGTEVHVKTAGGDEKDLRWANPRLEADLSNATAATINEIRQAFQIQRMYERDARGGTRYTEIIRSHFGVTSPDARLQRPEYLGGGSSPVNISPIASTAETDPQGAAEGRNLASLSAVGTASFQGHGFTKSFTEHCIIIGLVNVRADLTYQQGLNRMHSRQDRFDFYWPALSHLGEQEVLNKEIFTTGEAEDEDVFGYQERYAEYRYKPSQITGLFRSNETGGAPLDAWHLSEDYTELPELGPDWIVSQPPVDRVIAVPSEPHFIADFYHRMTCARPMPLYGVPGNIDRF